MKRKTIFRLLLAGFVLTLFLLIFELIARIAGELPYRAYPMIIERTEPSEYVVPDQTLGFRYNPGEFSVYFKNGFSFEASHNQSGHRITGTSQNSDSNKPIPEIWFLGGSVCYGQSLPDSLTFPWLIQEHYPNYKVRNFAGPGYSTLHSLLQFKQALLSENLPEIVVLTYAYYHDKRNSFALDFQKNMHSNSGMAKGVQFPFASLNENEEVVIDYKPYTYKPWPGMSISALVHWLEKKYITSKLNQSNPDQIAKALILEINRLCKQHNITLLVLGIRDDNPTNERIEFCRDNAIPARCITFDVTQPVYSLMPKDNHPNGLANLRFAIESRALIEKNRDKSNATPWHTRKTDLNNLLANKNNTMDSLRLIREFTAGLVDIGEEATNIENLYPEWTNLNLEEMYDLFELDMASANCGVISHFYQKLLSEYGFESIRYNIGDQESGLTHVTNLVNIENDNFMVQDATFNFSITDETQQPLGIREVLQFLNEKRPEKIQFRSKQDIKTEIILNQNLDLDTYLVKADSCGMQFYTTLPGESPVQPHVLVSKRDLDMLFGCNPLGNQYLDMLEEKGFPRDFKYIFLMQNGPLDGPGADSLQEKISRTIQNQKSTNVRLE